MPISNIEDIENLSQKSLQKYSRILSDPIKWGETFLNCEFRDFQKDILKNYTKRNIIRCARRSGKTWVLSVLLLWFAFTHKDGAVRIVTPLERHLEPYFKESFRKFINESEIISDSILSNQQRPYEIAFKNGSRITGYPSGAKTGGKSLNVRGQRCDILVIDEASFMNDESIDAAMALIMEHPEVIVFMASTPSGARNRFWLFSTDKSLGWKEFHYGAFESIPGWNEERDREARLSMTNEGYITEVLAEHGSDVGGVFPKNHLDNCMRNFSYVELDHDEEGIKLIGVDWDKYGAGCHMIVLKYYPKKQRFRVINHFVVPKSEYTLTNAIAKVIELNSKFDPLFIYVDAGYGETNIEVLHQHGIANPASELHKKLKGIAFNSNIEIIDPADGTVSKKQVKHWAVNNLLILIEGEIIEFNSDDIVLKREMETYKVEGYSITGPIYSKTNDHSISALLLAVLAYVQEISPISKPVLNAAKSSALNITKLSEDRSIKQYKKQNVKYIWDDPEFINRGKWLMPRRKHPKPFFSREI